VESAFATETEEFAKKNQRFNDVYFEAQNVNQEIDRLRRQLSAIEDRIDMMRLESFAPGFIHLAAAALPPTSPVPVKTGKWMGVLVFVGICLALGVPTLIDILDHRVRTPGDLVREAEGCVLLGVPERQPDTEPFIRDQLRRMALGLDRERRQRNRRRVVFTGVKSGAGTTQTVLELTRELRHLGVHAVAMEANALKPDPRFGGVNGQPGLINVLGGRVTLEQTVRPPDKGLPLRIPIGDTGGRNILVGANSLPRVFSEIMGQLEMVLVDAPPILLSSDAEMLAGMADAVVLVVGSYATTLADVRRAFRILRQVGTPVLQTIVNRVRVTEGGRGRDYADLIKEYNVVARAPSI
jgi:Mrp family chromosome partitioning ATPase